MTDSKIIALLQDRKFHVCRHLLLQLFILIITISIFFDAPDKLNLSSDRWLGWVGYFGVINLLIYVNAYILVPFYLIRDNLLKYVASVTLLILLSLVIITFLQEYFYDIAITNNEPSGVAIFFSLASSILSIGLIVVGVSAFLLFRHWVQKTRQADDLKSATLITELKYLKSQINPHFLFNMLNNANIMIKADPEIASRIILQLDSLLRYQIEDSAKDNVLLKDDIKFLETFLELEKIRRDRFEYTLTYEGNIDRIEVAPFLFLPFVENAVKHSPDNKGISYVDITFKVQNKMLEFSCSNSKPKKPSKKMGGLGLANIKKRLELLFINDYILEIDETEFTYSIYLSLPI
jgi:two-component system LytT family sensor kinase